MERFGSILAVLSDGDMPAHLHALAVDLARSDRAALTFVDVIDTDRPLPADGVVAARRARLADAVAKAELAGVSASEAVVRGALAVEVIRMVLREGHDLVLIAAAMAGDAAVRLIADCPCPVWSVGAGRPEAVIAVLPPVSEGGAARVVGMARTLAAHLGAEVLQAADIGAGRDMSAALTVAITPEPAAIGGSILAMKPEGFVSPVTLEAAPRAARALGANRGAGKG